MVRRSIEKIKTIIKWGKIILPLSSIRFYPPQFILRNPVIQGVTAAINDGHEVAVIVFNLKNMNELSEQLSQSQYALLIKQIKKYFRFAVETEIAKQDVITLNDFYGDGLTLYIKVDEARLCLSEIDTIMKKIINHVERNLQKYNPTIQTIFVTG
ncbi:hypothetical protein QNH39_22060 [Neobacillus novalis]|uniref:GGDEF domain-containing protein n=1 Tax=Neobacillus novalis TaxID=220687 RepID=A0AA95S7Y2_9BACI|nr:hypothetical protein [Neobacillus novalis]WHY85275.1 hypothetical protein QNH39_22060 [Neobacillus novalis]